MATTELDSIRVELAREILNTEDISLLRLVQRAYRQLVDKNEKLTEHSLQKAPCRYTIDEMQQRVQEALVDYQAGRVFPHDEIEKQTERWK